MPAAPQIGPPQIGMVVLQPTAFCNINCSYCYLPDRDNRHVLAPSTVTRLFTELFASGWAAPHLTVVWHAGEPLVVPVAFYREAFAAIERLRPPSVAVRHAFQTNGMLIDDGWCALFRDWEVGVGVSLDGPRELHDANRKTRSGAGTFDRTVAGIRRRPASTIPTGCSTSISSTASTMSASTSRSPRAATSRSCSPARACSGATRPSCGASGTGRGPTAA